MIRIYYSKISNKFIVSRFVLENQERLTFNKLKSILKTNYKETMNVLETYGADVVITGYRFFNISKVDIKKALLHQILQGLRIGFQLPEKIKLTDKRNEIKLIINGDFDIKYPEYDNDFQRQQNEEVFQIISNKFKINKDFSVNIVYDFKNINEAQTFCNYLNNKHKMLELK
jgi:hypothetical protein